MEPDSLYVRVFEHPIDFWEFPGWWNLLSSKPQPSSGPRYAANFFETASKLGLHEFDSVGQQGMSGLLGNIVLDPSEYLVNSSSPASYGRGPSNAAAGNSGFFLGGRQLPPEPCSPNSRNIMGQRMSSQVSK